MNTEWDMWYDERVYVIRSLLTRISDEDISKLLHYPINVIHSFWFKPFDTMHPDTMGFLEYRPPEICGLIERWELWEEGYRQGVYEAHREINSAYDTRSLWLISSITTCDDMCTFLGVSSDRLPSSFDSRFIVDNDEPREVNMGYPYTAQYEKARQFGFAYGYTSTRLCAMDTFAFSQMERVSISCLCQQLAFPKDKYLWLCNKLCAFAPTETATRRALYKDEPVHTGSFLNQQEEHTRDLLQHEVEFDHRWDNHLNDKERCYTARNLMCQLYGVTSLSRAGIPWGLLSHIVDLDKSTFRKLLLEDVEGGWPLMNLEWGQLADILGVPRKGEKTDDT